MVIELEESDVRKLAFWARYGIQTARAGSNMWYVCQMINDLNTAYKFNLGKCKPSSNLLDVKVKKEKP